ncbi:sodium-coupled monocarboxylate transporter 2-like [Phlebotomus papatasi]|uniref:sodium-coupled monocarboxylate transporter 2-like n=1 Tax=Phlebotomus papatasi TaxID=29031 RepID=UPI002483A1E7|nr:sodium-coupled monocarboxylate transporter 2-like [Phlebotomus papatasi]XP_055703692.1 sodium-coupled monocarboxylate transporter 2-like [Phlebotomus papatasi]
MVSPNVQFSILDYSSFIIVFIVSISIGLYQAGRNKNHSIEEYLFGGKNLKLLPVSLSLAATTISGSTIVGQSIEVYAYGLHNWMLLATVLPWMLVIQYIFLPVFYDLQLMSSFTYFEMRFDRSVKHLASALYVITGMFLIPLTIYVPSLVFQEVTGINLYVITVIMGLLCIWYTALGGIKAVVWTDAFQCILIFVSGITIMIVGLRSVGGFENIWNALDRGQRLTFFKTEFDVEERGTMWSYLFSIFFVYVYQFGINQSCIQRYLSLSSFKKATTSVWIYGIFCAIVMFIEIVIGGIIFTTYEQCDPVSAGLVKKFDQIFPHFVQEKASLFPGFNGIFIAGIFAAGLSTTSTLLNTLSGTIYNDFLIKKLKRKENAFKIIMRGIVAVVGIIGICLVFVIEQMGTVFAITLQCLTLSTVGVFGLFVSGMIFPKINSKGAKCGVVLSMVAVGVLIIGGLNKTPDPPLQLRIDGCDFLNSTQYHQNSSQNHNFLNRNATNTDYEDLPWIFKINFQYYSLIGLLINISVAQVVSFLSGGNIVEDQRLLVTFLRRNTPQEPLI